MVHPSSNVTFSRTPTLLPKSRLQVPFVQSSNIGDDTPVDLPIPL